MILARLQDPLSKVSGLKFFDTTRSWTRYYPTCFQALLHYLYLLHVKEFSYKFFIAKSFSVLKLQIKMHFSA